MASRDADRGEGLSVVGHRVSHAYSTSNPANSDGREGREVNSAAIPSPTPLQTVRSTGLLPFTAKILEAPMPEKPRPVFDKYDGSPDPGDHLRTFINAMTFYSSNDPVMCRAFSLSLKGEKWF